ncbi:MAG: bacteriocin family protein [Candidatus Glassbacteria bacterium]|nr:bacteriocin family protein [Candidatus Glassbacteria bacterium]
MSDILRRSLAPLTEAAWKEIDRTASNILKASLTGRKLVDCDGPHGLELGAVNLGRLAIPEKHKRAGVSWGVREVLPLVELRVPFQLDQMELDSISRGSKDVDLGPLEKAARAVVDFEESAIYKGFPEARVQGILKAAKHAPLKIPAAREDCPKAVAEGIKLLSEAGIEGPYALVLCLECYHELIATAKGYPTFRVAERLVEGGIFYSSALKGGVLLSVRGGDFELTLGQDISIGFSGCTADKVELYFAESFTFRVLEPLAAVELKP